MFAGAAFVSVFLNSREASLFVVGLLLAGFVGVNRLGYDEFAFIRRGTVLRMYEAPVVKRSMFVVFADIAMAVLASYVAIALKADSWSLASMRTPFLSLSGMAAPLTVLVFWKTGLYRGAWRLAGVDDLMRACGASAAVTVLALVAHIIWSPAELSVSVFLIYGLVSAMLVTGSRASYVVLLSRQRRLSNQGTPVLLYGAGSGGVGGVRELFEHPETGLRPIGFIDDDPGKTGKLVSGLPVLGGHGDLESIIRGHGVRALLVSTSSIRQDRAQKAKEICERSGVSLFKLDIRLERLHDAPEAPEPAPALRMPQPMLVPAPAAEAAPAFIMEDIKVIGTQPCLSCGSRNVHRSKARNLYERFKKLHTAARLYRCHDCRWRGWLLPLEYAPIIAPEAIPEPGDLTALDSLFEQSKPHKARLTQPARDPA
jgi:hypothetical protein